jgi:uncharacterized membrane protein
MATEQTDAPESTDPDVSTTDAADGADSQGGVLGRWRRRRRFRYTVPGAWVALVFACLSFTPSLLPRSGLAQGLICGITAAIGYGLGVLGAWVWRAFADRDERPTASWSWKVFGVVAVIALLASFFAGRVWQSQVRDLMGMDEPGPAILVLPFVAALIFVFLVWLARALRRIYQWLARQLERIIGPRAARGVGWVVVVGGTYLLVSGLLLQGLSNFANESFSVRNGITQDGVTQPTVTTRSGGPESLVSWDSLGREGRTFMSGGPTAAEIAAFSDTEATEPIRAYAGLESADDSEARARLAVDDLERAGGFQREYLMVATTTGSGWVSPGGANTFEYMTDGDSAIVAMQYSYLPSWISYLVDQKKAREAGRDLFDAVYERWSALPEDDRPQLVIFGESLGTFGAETAFSGEADLANRTDGALLTGPPNFNTLWSEFVAAREKGTTEVQPVFRDGRTVRFDGSESDDIPPVGQPWPDTRVLYIQHPSDPIVWWSPNLILNEPDWLREPRGVDVDGATRWFPFVTFWQLTMDLPGATAVPGGHGHDYTTNYVDGWAEVLTPAGWTPEKRDALQAIIAPDEDEG